MNKQGLLVALAASLVAAGCSVPEEPSPSTPARTVTEPTVSLTASAGVPVAAAETPVDIRAVAKTKRFARRSDPFALRPEERAFEREQEMLRVFGQIGGFTVQYTPPEVESPEPQDFPEPQPYRRLAGVVVGDSVLALIDMGDGTLRVIRPGETIEGTEWRVASIDSDKAILRRSGNRTPRQVIVRLESPPAGIGGGGFPGGAPGGFPGGPGGAPGRPGIGGPGGDPGLGGNDF